MRVRSATLVFVGLILAGLWLFGGTDRERSGLGGIPAPLTGPGVVELEVGEEEEEAGALTPVGEWLYVQTVGPEATTRIEAYRRALDQAAALRERTLSEAPELAAAEWTHVGPFARGGRIADVAVDPRSHETVYAAAASGGVWKSTDAGLTWVSSWPTDLTQTTGALASGSDGTLFAGTGDPVPTRGFVVSGGSGVYRSLDSGRSWEPLGLGGSGSIGRIVVDPQDPSRVFAAAAGSPLIPGGERGLFRSSDGGDTWQQVLQAPNPTTGAIDLAIDPEDPRNLLVAMWDRDGKRLGGSGSGLYVSRDGGDTWGEARLPGNVAASKVGRIGVAFAPSDPSRAYAIVSNDLDGEPVGLWRSDDGGRTWSMTTAAPESLNQSIFGWWFGRLWVHPSDADRLFVGGTALIESSDGGDSFSVVGLTAASQQGIPTNQHAMAWDPKSEGLVYLGTDGGMLRSVGNAASGTWVRASSQGWTQRFSASGPSWSTIDPVLTSGVRGPPPEPYGTTTVVADSRSDPGVSYMGTAEGKLWRSADAGTTWDALKDGDQMDDLPESWVTHIVVDPSDSDVVFAVFTDARSGHESVRLIGTTDGGATWVDLTEDLPSAPVNDVIVLPGDRLVAATDVGVFLRSEGGTWLAVGSSLPAAPVIDIRFEQAGNAITASTFGHGLQRVTLP